MNRLIKYFYPEEEVSYFDNLKTKFFIFQGYIGLVIVALYIIPDIVSPNDNFIFSFFSKIIGAILLTLSMFILKIKGIRVAGNFYSLVLVIMVLVFINIIDDNLSPIYKHIQGYYSIFGLFAVGLIFASRTVLLINAVLIFITTTHVYIYSKEYYPNDADFFTTGYQAHTVAIVFVTTIFYFANKFTEFAIKKADNELEIKEKTNMELTASEEEIRATNEELMATTDALKESNNELISAIEKIKESEAKFKQLSDLTFEGIFTHVNGVVIDVNQAFLNMTGYNEDELLGKNIINFLIPKEYHASLFENMTKDYAAPTQIKGIIKNGTIIPIEFESKIIDKEKSIRVVAVRDITERKKHERELIIAKEKAEESDRLKVEFLNNMSHEVRTPMNGILGFAQLLNIPDLTSKTRESYSKIILNSSNQLLSIIDNIIEISKLGTKQVKLVENELNLNGLLLELFLIFEIKANGNQIHLQLKNKLPDGESQIFTDEIKLYKIISNLLENALKFTTKGSIKLGYDIITIDDSKLLQLYVKDTGIGIESDKQDMIFNRFSQADPKLSRQYGGLGLGLSIAKENTILLGGQISLDSEIGKGSTFFITIPYKPVNQNQ